MSEILLGTLSALNRVVEKQATKSSWSKSQDCQGDKRSASPIAPPHKSGHATFSRAYRNGERATVREWISRRRREAERRRRGF